LQRAADSSARRLPGSPAVDRAIMRNARAVSGLGPIGLVELPPADQTRKVARPERRGPLPGVVLRGSPHQLGVAVAAIVIVVHMDIQAELGAHGRLYGQCGPRHHDLDAVAFVRSSECVLHADSRTLIHLAHCRRLAVELKVVLEVVFAVGIRLAVVGVRKISTVSS
jgi:hypothetical protein